MWNFFEIYGNIFLDLNYRNNKKRLTEGKTKLVWEASLRCHTSC